MSECVGTPHCFVLLQEEIVISVQQMNHLYFNFSLRMGESAELFIVAFYVLIRVGFAELGFVAAGVVHLLNLVMRKVTFLVVTITFSTKFMTV